MIILKILLFILLAVLGLTLLVLIMPVGGEVSFIGGKLKYKVNLWAINVMDSDGGGILGWLKRHKAKKKKNSQKKKKSVKSGKFKWKRNAKADIPPEDNLQDVPEQKADFTAADDNSGTEIPENSDSALQDSEAKDLTENVQTSEQTLENSCGNDDSDDDLFDDILNDRKIGKKNKVKKKGNDDEEKGKSLSEKFDMLIDIWGSAKNPLCLIFKAFKFSDLYIDFVIADEDAYKCALNYGRLSAVTFRGLALMSRIFTVRLKTVDVQPCFGLKKGRFDAAFKLKFRAGTFVIAGLWFLITYIFRVFIPGKLNRRKKSVAVQK